MLRQLSGQQLIELSIENTVGHELQDSSSCWLSLRAPAYIRRHEVQNALQQLKRYLSLLANLGSHTGQHADTLFVEREEGV